MPGSAQASRAAALLAVLLVPVATMAQDADAGPPGDPVAGRKVARACSQCHGIDGIAKQPDAANLAGQDPAYLVRQLTAFKNGDRKNDIMSAMAQTVDDKQMRDVAAYYGGIRIEIKSVPGE